VTRDELTKYLDQTECVNGFANRFLFTCVRRSKTLPEGGDIAALESALGPIGRRLAEIVEFAKSIPSDQGQLRRDEEATELWREVYPALSEGRPGLLGAVLARGEAQVMRLASMYAVLDMCAQIRRPHLEAALAVWRYSEESARYIFGNALGDPVADEVLRVLRCTPAGLTQTDLVHHFGRNLKAGELARALAHLEELLLVRHETERTEGKAGRPPTRWFATGG
jgi:hypothetical protein